MTPFRAAAPGAFSFSAGKLLRAYDLVTGNSRCLSMRFLLVGGDEVEISYRIEPFGLDRIRRIVDDSEESASIESASCLKAKSGTKPHTRHQLGYVRSDALMR